MVTLSSGQDAALRGDAALLTGGNLAAAQMTVNLVATQIFNLSADFTTTSLTYVSVTSFTLTPASARTRALLIIQLRSENSSAAAINSWAVTNSDLATNDINYPQPAANEGRPHTFTGMATTMGTACQLQMKVGAGTGKLVATGATNRMLSVEF